MSVGMNGVFQYFIDELDLNDISSTRSQEGVTIGGSSYLDAPSLQSILEAATTMSTKVKISAASNHVNIRVYQMKTIY